MSRTPSWGSGSDSWSPSSSIRSYASSSSSFSSSPGWASKSGSSQSPARSTVSSSSNVSQDSFWRPSTLNSSRLMPIPTTPTQPPLNPVPVPVTPPTPVTPINIPAPFVSTEGYPFMPTQGSPAPISNANTSSSGFTNSSSFASSTSNNVCVHHAHARASAIPHQIPKTNEGLPDVTKFDARFWVESLAKNCSHSCLIPSWLPKIDGKLDISKPVSSVFLQSCPKNVFSEHQCRIFYYLTKLTNPNSRFHYLIQEARSLHIPLPPQTRMSLEEAQRIQESMMVRQRNPSRLNNFGIPTRLPQIEYSELGVAFGETGNTQLGRGAYGAVFKRELRGQIVAIKKIASCPHSWDFDRYMEFFVKELKIMTLLGGHPNIVSARAYALNPLCIVMELVELGSLSNVLYNCKVEEVEARIATGSIKKKIILGVVDGMAQLHAIGITHGDLKPDNVLVDRNYTAKIADFGLSILRKRSSSNSGSSSSSSDDSSGFMGGTQGYTAPELLEAIPASFMSDVYSFGILLNEIIQEEEPYAGERQNFPLTSELAIVQYAYQGNRPKMHSQTPLDIRRIIESCWISSPQNRPKFEALWPLLWRCNFPNSFFIQI